MKIEDYEPYHIGIKLKSYVDLDVLKNRIIEILKKSKEGYKTIKEGIEAGVLKVNIIPLREILATRNDTKIELNFPANALNTIGKNPTEVLVVFKELIAMLPKIRYDINATVSLYEVISTIFISGIESEKIFKKILNINQKNIDSLGLNLQANGFRLRSLKEIPTADFIIEPNPINPKTSLSLKLAYRCNTVKELEIFHNNVEKSVSTIIKSIGV